MDDEKKPELLIEKLSRIRIRPRDTLLLSLVGSIVMIIISIVFGVVRILLGPYGQAISIYLWLSGSGYIDEFEYDIEKNGLFKFEFERPLIITTSRFDYLDGVVLSRLLLGVDSILHYSQISFQREMKDLDNAFKWRLMLSLRMFLDGQASSMTTAIPVQLRR
jgi:hypothetical protein